jgi:hypothetical protein
VANTPCPLEILPLLFSDGDDLVALIEAEGISDSDDLVALIEAEANPTANPTTERTTVEPRTIERIAQDIADGRTGDRLPAFIVDDIVAASVALVQRRDAEAEAANEERLAWGSTSTGRRLAWVQYTHQLCKSYRMHAECILYELVKEYELARSKQ